MSAAYRSGYNVAANQDSAFHDLWSALKVFQQAAALSTEQFDALVCGVESVSRNVESLTVGDLIALIHEAQRSGAA